MNCRFQSEQCGAPGALQLYAEAVLLSPYCKDEALAVPRSKVALCCGSPQFN